MMLKMAMTMMIILILVELHFNSSLLPALVTPNVGVTIIYNHESGIHKQLENM